MATDRQSENYHDTTNTDDSNQYLSDERRRLYEFVRDHEPVERDRIREFGSRGDPRAVAHHCAILERLGALVADGRRYRIGFDVSTLPRPKAVARPATGESVTIRPVKWSEYRSLSDILQRRSRKRLDVATERIARRVARERRLFRQDRLCERVVCIAHTNDGLCGWILLDASPAKNNNTVTLTSGVLAPHGPHLERSLREYGLEWARSRGYGKVYRPLPATNESAIEMLEADGWEIDAKRDGRYRTEADEIDEVILAWRLDAEPDRET